jgi:hypothetical protein
MKSIVLLACCFLDALTSMAQVGSPMVYGRVTRQLGHVTIESQDARPLAQAVVAARQEYGWLVDYEDPLYQGSDLIDGRTEDFMASHPRAKLMLKPRGGRFAHQFSIDPKTILQPESLTHPFIQELVESYAQSGNPGTFSVVTSGPHRLSVVGRNTGYTSALDTLLNLSFSNTNGLAALTTTLHEITPIIGHKVGVGIVPPNPLLNCTFTNTYTHVPARTVIIDLLAACHINAVWQMLYDANQDVFLLNLEGVATVSTDIYGRRIYKQVAN